MRLAVKVDDGFSPACLPERRAAAASIYAWATWARHQGIYKKRPQTLEARSLTLLIREEHLASVFPSRAFSVKIAPSSPQTQYKPMGVCRSSTSKMGQSALSQSHTSVPAV